MHLTRFFSNIPQLFPRGPGVLRHLQNPAASCSPGSWSFPRSGCSRHPRLTGPVTPSYDPEPFPATPFQGFSPQTPLCSGSTGYLSQLDPLPLRAGDTDRPGGRWAAPPTLTPTRPSGAAGTQTPAPSGPQRGRFSAGVPPTAPVRDGLRDTPGCPEGATPGTPRLPALLAAHPGPGPPRCGGRGRPRAPGRQSQQYRGANGEL